MLALGFGAALVAGALLPAGAPQAVKMKAAAVVNAKVVNLVIDRLLYVLVKSEKPKVLESILVRRKAGLA